MKPHVIGLSCPPIPAVNIAIIGLGNRGMLAVHRLLHIPGCRIMALCDLQPERLKEASTIITSHNTPSPALYSDPDNWKLVCERADIDLIYNCTHWQLHTPIAVYAMQQGKHVAIEVPAALSVRECWQLVDTAEATRRHCMMLENCCYDPFELATLNMARQGLFGEIVHAEGAYIHDLRAMNFDPHAYYGMWSLRYNEQHTGNPYPTHGLGPLCQLLRIHRSDRMEYLVSISSAQFGMTEYAREKFGPESAHAQKEYKKGDMNTTLIRTMKGKTLMIQHDISNPRPYSRIYHITGTQGMAQKWPVPLFAFAPGSEEYLSQAEAEALLRTYEHPFVKEYGEKGKEVAGERRLRDFIMDSRLIHCLNQGLPLDQDVYDAAEWSCLVELTQYSVNNGSVPVEIPDFTRGRWKE